jgi:hypothetical protein
MSSSPHAAEAGLGQGDPRAATPTVIEEAAGAVAAQQVVDAAGPPDLAWLRVAELAGRFGWKSIAVRAFVVELAKRAGCRGA